MNYQENAFLHFPILKKSELYKNNFQYTIYCKYLVLKALVKPKKPAAQPFEYTDFPDQLVAPEKQYERKFSTYRITIHSDFETEL